MLRLEGLHHTGFFVRKVSGNRYQVEIAVAEHSEIRFQVGKFAQARSAPGGPEVYKQHFTRGIRTKLFEIVRGHHIDLDWFGIDLLQLVQLTVDFRLPFGRTAKRRRMSYGHRLVRQQRPQRVSGVLRLNKRSVLAVVDPPFIAKLPIRIEDKDMGSRLGSIGSRYRLGVPIIKVRKVKVTILSANLHVIERVANVGIA